MAFDYDLERKGTRTLISLLIPALEALSTGSLLVVDELDTSLHPDLAKAFVSLFNRESSNPHGAQLIFSTHDVTLLGSGSIQQDEIWMTDKDRDGVSRFTPLTEFKLRSRDDIEKAYRKGRLGGVPSADDFYLELSRGPSPTNQ
ncbi:MAG: ATP-binding protein [Proteobacteria bacterium]|nr:ATP-binding protein [Pseudomonadota bacterium]